MNQIETQPTPTFHPQLFAGRTVLVSGATSGIGLAIAEGFAGFGAQVIATGSSPAKLEALQADRSLAGIRFAALDVRDGEAIERFAAGLETLDVLVNAAGVARPFDEYRDDVFREVLDVNLTAAMRLSMAARAHLERTRGCVVNIASMLSYLADAEVPAYCASKTGILGLTRALAHAFGVTGVRVNAIAPGYHRTDMTRPLWESPTAAPKIAARSALKRWGEAEDLVGATLFLASPAAAFVTGVTLPVDGGYASGS
ncbi:SDR family NAD(P)-dependent oxidoreductase [Burkholderia sp. Ac-20379]|uniref:SDR family NAD(P)-dependent oxidoreductase n=1 Tax=Burkholderia sp. Ac-20379 TaxID=2703900 RepID=UPI001981E375|nr:SDR family oxidoreductase [Burkholderia sp. Ac-20379]MBN3724131.1 SDR family oxidoreductase [Burkholderia sp. Ac-20379]